MNSSNSSRTSAESADDQFGPAFGGPGRSFDFTLLFEDSILAIAPSALFLTAACVRGFALHGSPARVRSSNSQLFKTVSTTRRINNL
jgi:ATP-binding cassette subfamily C (CFTR/MRP) protein 1